MTPSNAELAEQVSRLDRRTTNLTETLGYMQDDLHGVAVEQKSQGRRLDRIEKRVDGLDGRLGRIEKRVGGIDRRLDGIDGRLDAHDQQFVAINGRLDDHGDLLREILRRLPEA